MRLCYLVLAEQAEKKNEQRDYTEAQRLFAEAQRLYDARPNASGEDLEMGKLKTAMEELERGGWGKVEEQATIAMLNLSTATTKPTEVAKKQWKFRKNIVQTTFGRLDGQVLTSLIKQLQI